ncbi:ABC transporter permease [Anaerocolumna sp. AGMB13020]|uniref:ABC transporter permease n=1 Tax=Anaerocolumna sp. AGMB13020 TaxID=3081750 RepID=UPI002954C191|nr:ABC transporter permease [Anaerocolumna sp. AGMB13020]WOO37966.1 ABC transporter permease [Anaerocolumna sp. AGMB13020]
MLKLLKSDLYRLGKSKLLYGVIGLVIVLSFLLTLIIHQDIRLGISVFGNLTAFQELEDIIRLGTEYQKGLGILVAILISIWIGQEYQWKTWQHKYIISKTRTGIYLSKAIVSLSISASVYLLFVLIAFLSSGQAKDLIASGYFVTIFCGISLYGSLGAVLCLLSMLIKNYTASTITCLCYVLFSETIWSAIRNLSGFSSTLAGIVEAGMRHSIYGMSVTISSASFTADMSRSIVLNSVVIILIATLLGLTVFRKYEL